MVRFDEADDEELAEFFDFTLEPSASSSSLLSLSSSSISSSWTSSAAGDDNRQLVDAEQYVNEQEGRRKTRS